MKLNWKIVVCFVGCAACEGGAGETGGPDAWGDGSELSACAESGIDTLWDVGNLHGPIASMALSSQGIVVLGSDDGSVKQWSIGLDAATAPLAGGRPSYGEPLVEAGATVGAVAFAGPDLLIAGDAAGVVSVYRTGDIGLDSSMPFSADTVTALSAAGDRVAIADASFGGNIRVWNRSLGDISEPYATALWGVTSVELDGDDLFAAGDDYGEPSIERHDVAGVDRWVGTGLISSIRDIALTPDGGHVVAAADDFVFLFDATNLAAGPIATAELDGVSSVSISVSPAGAFTATVGSDGVLRVWRTQTLTAGGTIAAADPSAVVIDTSGQRIITASRDSRLRAFGCASAQ